MFWTVGGVILLALGSALLLDIKGAAGALWRFWVYCWERWSFPPRQNQRFIRLWLGVLCVVIGAAWIYAGS